jgi:hypothetical protein
MPDNAGKTVAEILQTKQGSIKNAPLPPGSPSWDDIMSLSWEEIVEKDRQGVPGFATFKKLLERKRFNK